MEDALRTIEGWVTEKAGRYICLADVHSIMRAREDDNHFYALSKADLVLPDGMPLVWSGRIRRVGTISRVSGPDLMAELCSLSTNPPLRHYFLGGAIGIPDQLARALSAKHPSLNVCGAYSPPFRAMTPLEQAQVINDIKEAAPNIVWVGLGCPKQEAWMVANARHLPGMILIGVGAAFDFHSGRIRRAPLWMRRFGLEWLHRLIKQPRRLWRRYLLVAPTFVALETWEMIVRLVRQVHHR